MKSIKKTSIYKTIYSLALAVAFVILVRLGILDWLDQWLQDNLYQKPQYVNGDVILFGIDEQTLTTIGPYNTWDRNIMAQALENLASDPEKRPAAVAIDTLYSGETDPEADERLAKAAEELGCVVTATAASFSSGWFKSDDGSAEWDDYRIVLYEEPYDALKEVTSQGHINAMYDTDGIMRHGIMYIDPGERVYSMPYKAVELYCRKLGKPFVPPETNERGQFYVTFTGKSGDYYDQSFLDLYEGNIPPDYYEDKIVFIGPYAAGLQDAYFTPIDRSNAMYGVEFQANETQQFLNSNYRREIPNNLQYMIMFAVLFLLYIFFFSKKILPSTALGSASIVIWLFCAVKIYDKGIIVHPLWIPVGIFAGYVVSVVFHYLSAAKARRQITSTFERYVAPEIVQEILKEGTGALSLGGKLCDIAVLFVDVRGFTTMSERLDPEKVVFILNRYLTMASGCVEDNKGTLDKFVGDAMMAFWGAPLPQEDAVFNAVKTAQEIVEGAARVSDELKEEIGEELRVGVGVHFGPAVVGNMGAERHMDYTAIGDTVNTAARLEANAPGGCVYISRVVADALEGRIRCTSLGGTVKLKGKAEGFEVLKLEEILDK